MNQTTNIEPAEEQRSDAAAFYYKSINNLPLDVADWVETGEGTDNVDDDVLGLARLLAEREHRLREELKSHAATNFGFAVTLDAELSAARARIADLESERVASIEARRAVDQHRREREAAHLTENERLRAALDDVLPYAQSRAEDLHESGGDGCEHWQKADAAVDAARAALTGGAR